MKNVPVWRSHCPLPRDAAFSSVIGQRFAPLRKLSIAWMTTGQWGSIQVGNERRRHVTKLIAAQNYSSMRKSQIVANGQTREPKTWYWAIKVSLVVECEFTRTVLGHRTYQLAITLSQFCPEPRKAKPRHLCAYIRLILMVRRGRLGRPSLGARFTQTMSTPANLSVLSPEEQIPNLDARGFESSLPLHSFQRLQ